MTPVFSSSECVISRVLSCFYLSEGVRPFSCFFVLATVVLLNVVISRVLAWFWVDLGKIAFFYMTLFLAFRNLGLFGVFVGRCYFSSFGLVLSGLGIIIVCVLRLIFALKLWSFVAVLHACRRWQTTKTV